MARILFATWDGGGNVPPALGIAAELTARGHDVKVMGHAGQGFDDYATARPFKATAKNSPVAYARAFGDRRMAADVLAEPADLVVVDCMLFAVMDALRRAGRPYIVLEHLYDGYLRQKWLRGPLGMAMRAMRLRPTQALDGAARCLVTSLGELDPGHDGTPPANVAFTGPVVTGTPAAAAQPTILVSLSTCNYPGQQAVLQNVLDAVAELPARTLVTTGPMTYDDLRVPARVELHGYVSHAELMPTLSLVIGHGGHATTMAALAHDLPLLILPMHPLLDQPLVAESVERAGAGRRLPKKASPAAIRAAVAELLAPGPHREAAARLGAAIRAARGAATAADEIERITAKAPTVAHV